MASGRKSTASDRTVHRLSAASSACNTIRCRSPLVRKLPCQVALVPWACAPNDPRENRSAAELASFMFCSPLCLSPICAPDGHEKDSKLEQGSSDSLNPRSKPSASHEGAQPLIISPVKSASVHE